LDVDPPEWTPWALGRWAGRGTRTVRALLHAGMAVLTIDLDPQLDNLRGLKNDLEEFHHSSAAVLAPHERDGVSIAIAQLAQRIMALEEIARRCESDEVRVEGVTADETRALDHAIDVLDVEFCPNESMPPATVWSRIRQLLAAADDLL